MHAATLYAQIDEHSAENGIADDIVLQTYERALELNKLHTQNNPTKDYIALETINYLLKIGSTEEAQKRTQAFLSGTPTNMIKSFISNGGLTNGRFEHIASNPELSNTIITTLSNT